MYDLTVVGGGPAGATCARLAAKAGLDVVLLEKEHHPREKPCGGALGPRTIQNLDIDISPLVEQTFNTAVIHTPESILSLTSEQLIGHIVTRSEFDAYLLQKAENAGVEVIQDTEVVGIEQLRSAVRALVVGDSYKSHILVGADGVNGIIARELGIRTKWAPEQIALCIQATIQLSVGEVESVMMRNKIDNSPAIELFFGIVPWGYAWCFPKRDGFNIGVGCRMDKQEALQKTWHRFVSRIREEKGIELDESSKISYRLPLGGKLDRLIGRRGMLVGDAAGLVSPLTGEGISYAIQSGILAAKIASETIETKAPLHVKEYDNQLKKTVGRELADTRWLAGILHRSYKHTDLLFQIASEDPVMRKYFTNVVARIATFSEYRTKIVKRMLTRHTMKALRLGLTR
ncbi:MAG: NAD(P)/FAD-dependent oxidoreductase [Candidatus Thorarchaeota archaeon]